MNIARADTMREAIIARLCQRFNLSNAYPVLIKGNSVFTSPQPMATADILQTVLETITAAGCQAAKTVATEDYVQGMICDLKKNIFAHFNITNHTKWSNKIIVSVDELDLADTSIG